MIKPLHSSLTAVVCGVLLGMSATGNPQEWTRFRGSNGTGIGLAKGIPSKFTVADAAWRVALKGEGHSSPVLWGDRVFITGHAAAQGAFVVQHGSWNRRTPSGYKVVWVPFRDGRPAGKPRDIVTGFLDGSGKARGRPVGVAWDAARGALLVADDLSNTVWRVTFAAAAPAA